ncbi:PD-(D/E)XK nuclease superfamily protein [Salana multivorans]|uniref:PD-(D/E)XK nuclease superfamily protein n=1 Tax=Salana multivorans TaxID=120377 RepID=A0A3N2D6Y8_9MICO|nr:PD-(D/E)XK nuclease family protein [Salana multivorans]ROR95530.1 PD-(D/E)XK nuclease superfamily protein [Salana multivorans]
MPSLLEARHPTRLSYSALSTYANCGEQFRLERLYGVRGGTYWSTIGGSAFHVIGEAMALRSLGIDVEQPSFEDAFGAELEKVLQRNGITEDQIIASGRVVKGGLTPGGGPNKKNRDWWLHYGPQMVSGLARWLDEDPGKVWIAPTGEPAIELLFDIEIAGVPVRGYIDMVREYAGGFLRIVDLKGGNRPMTTEQLGVYSEAIRQMFDAKATQGAYWMAQEFLPDPRDPEAPAPKIQWESLVRYTPDYFDARFGMARDGIDAGVYLANPSNLCGGCSVRDFCRLQGGARAEEVPYREPKREMVLACA